MKYLPTILIFLFACSKQRDPVPVKDRPVPEVCEWGIESERSKPINPHRLKSVIYLDFDGEVVQSGNWNSGQVINCEPSGISDTAWILKRVQEDFKLFDVIVTNKEEDYNTANPYKRIRIIITATVLSGGGGTAYIGSFTWGDNTPAFVYSSVLPSSKWIADAISHEAGHTLALRHQAVWEGCVFKSEYRDGVLMGRPYYWRSGWSEGLTPISCTLIQKDAELIKQTLKK